MLQRFALMGIFIFCYISIGFSADTIIWSDTFQAQVGDTNNENIWRDIPSVSGGEETSYDNRYTKHVSLTDHVFMSASESNAVTFRDESYGGIFANLYDTITGVAIRGPATGEGSQEDTLTLEFFLYNQSGAEALGDEISIAYWMDTFNGSSSYSTLSSTITFKNGCRGYYITIDHLARSGTFWRMYKSSGGSVLPTSDASSFKSDTSSNFFRIQLALTDSGNHTARIFDSSGYQINQIQANSFDFIPGPNASVAAIDTLAGTMMRYSTWGADARIVTDTWSYSVNSFPDVPASASVPSSNRHGEKRIGNHIFIENRWANRRP